MFRNHSGNFSSYCEGVSNACLAKGIGVLVEIETGEVSVSERPKRPAIDFSKSTLTGGTRGQSSRSVGV